MSADPPGPQRRPAHGASPVDWVREEVQHYRRTGQGLRGRAVVLLETTGRRSGLIRTTPLMRVHALGTWAVVASWRGNEQHPAWYLNVLADPRVVLQDGVERHALVTREVDGAERAAWWSRACGAFPAYSDYASATGRRIPVLVLERG